MKISLLCLLIALTVSAKAQNYYFKLTGSDASSGCPIGAPCKTVTKANSLTGNKHFYAGDVFPGTCQPKAGETWDTYSTGANATITGFVTPSGSWVDNGDGTWSITDGAMPASMVGMVLVDGNQVNIGRTPRTGYNTFSSHSNSMIVSTTSVGTFTGKKEVGVRKTDYTLDRFLITSISGNTINYSGGGGISTSIWNGNGYFIQNAPECLLLFGDWCYDYSAHKLTMYFGPGQAPSGHVIQVSSLNYGIQTSAANVVINHLDLTGQNLIGLVTTNANNFTYTNGHIYFQGQNGSQMFNVSNLTMTGNEINNCANTGAVFTGASNNRIFSSNLIHDCGSVAGMGLSQDISPGSAGSYSGVVDESNSSNNGTWQYNEIYNIGYNPLWFAGQNQLIEYNYIHQFGYVLQDNAGIYTHGTTLARHGVNNINHNLIKDGVGSPLGTIANKRLTHGIYWDDGTTDASATYNTIQNVTYGLFPHNSQYITMNYNWIYDSAIGITPTHDGILLAGKTTGLSINYNQVVSTSSGQINFRLYSVASNSSAADLINWGTAAHNYYATTYGNLSGFQSIVSPTGTKSYTLATWRTATAQDATSTFTNITDPVRFDINHTASSVPVSISNSYVDLPGATYSPPTYSLPAYSGSFLIQTASPPPVLPAFAYPTPLTYTYGQTVTIVPNSVSNVTSYTAASLPSGLSINATTGNISGTLTAAHVAAGYPVVGHNVSGTTSFTINITVNKVPLTITANNKSKPQGSPNPTLTASYSGFVLSDSPGSLTTLPTLSTTAVTGSHAGLYPITVSGAISSNYTFTYVPGVLFVFGHRGHGAVVIGRARFQ